MSLLNEHMTRQDKTRQPGQSNTAGNPTFEMAPNLVIHYKIVGPYLCRVKDE
jgi:hypothetical protein